MLSLEKLSLGKEFLRSLLRYGTFFKVLPSGRFELTGMIESLAMNNGMSPK